MQTPSNTNISGNKDMEFPLGAWLEEKRASGELKEDTYRKIVRGNAERIFGL